MRTEELSLLISRAVGTLQELEQALTAAVSAAPSGAPAAPFLAEPAGREAEIAARLKSFWSGVRLSPIYTVGDDAIDLTTPQGRWELLALAVLRGARVQETVVERTFHELREAGLLKFARAAAGRSNDRRKTLAILERSYRALGKKESKADAIFENAARLAERWSGDLNRLYDSVRGDDQALVAELQSFRQIRQTAYWIARTMRVHGIWSDVGVEAIRHFDRSTRLPIDRLGLAPPPGDERTRRQPERTAAIVDGLLDGDPLPLFLNGATLCSQDDPATCLCECPVAAWCSYPGRARRGAGRGGKARGEKPWEWEAADSNDSSTSS